MGQNGTTAVTEVGTNESNFKTLHELEKEHFYLALKLTQGNKVKAAKLLGITVKSVYNKLYKYEALFLENV